MSIVLQSSGGGQITLQEPTTASNFTQTLPAANGVTMVSGNMPAFSAYQSVAQSITAGSNTKLTFTTEEFDTNSNFASSRFTPTVAGYYQANASFFASSSFTTGQCAIFKNGSQYKVGLSNGGSSSGTWNGWGVSCLVYLNGSTDYIEAYGLYFATQNTATGSDLTYFQASMVRAA